MNVSQMASGVSGGILVALVGLAAAVLLYWRYRAQNGRLALAMVVIGAGWSVMSFFRISGLIMAMDDDAKALVGLTVFISGLGGLALLIAAVISAVKSQRDRALTNERKKGTRYGDRPGGRRRP